MSRPRVAMSILERKSAHPMMRVSPRSQPLPAARQPMHKGKHSTAETAALIKRARALLAKPVAIKVPALKPCIATLVLDRSIARKERISSATLKLKESLQPVDPRPSAPALPVKPSVAMSLKVSVPQKPKRNLAAPLVTRSPGQFRLAPSAPRAPRFHEVRVEPARFPSFVKPKDGPRGILRKADSQSKCTAAKKVAFGGVSGKLVQKWIGIRQGVETEGQLSHQGITVVGKSLHVHPMPCRIIGSQLQGWAKVGSPDDFDYQYFFGTTWDSRQRWNGNHLGCQNPGCNRRDLRRFHGQDKPNRVAAPGAYRPYI